MRVNTRVRYGLRAMLQIAQGYGGPPVPISAIAADQQISSKYLEQVVGALRRAGLIRSYKGVRGGYALVQPPEDITLWQVIRALDPHEALIDCVNDPACCDRSGDCLTRTVWALLSTRLRDFWTDFTLGDLLTKASEMHAQRETASTR